MTFSLRPWTMNDLPSLVKYANNPKIASRLTDAFPHPYTKENGKAFIEMATKNSPVNVFCIDINGEACGGIGLHAQQDVHRKNMEMGYWLAEPYWGKGIITNAITQTVEYGFRNFDITRIFARPYGSNLASQRVLEKAGFKLEAKLERTLFKNGIFEDEFIYAVRRK
jgi:RimJ/RimL family protein N-acetyltransferase